MIPGLPKGGSPPTPVLQTHFSILNELYFPSTAKRTPSQPSQSASASTADEGQVLDRAVYTVINNWQCGIPAREQLPGTKQNKNTEYAAINVS